jgi:hypothetical protein
LNNKRFSPSSAPVNALLEAGLEIQSFMVSRGWEFCFIGGVAVLRWGEPRLTRDLDLTLLTGFGNEAEYVDPLLDSIHPPVLRVLLRWCTVEVGSNT